MQPPQFSLCSRSDSSKDQAFADRLRSRMVQDEVRIWYAPEGMRGGIWPRSTGGRRNADDSLSLAQRASVGSTNGNNLSLTIYYHTTYESLLAAALRILQI
jgi:hypothetical protein